MMVCPMSMSEGLRVVISIGKRETGSVLWAWTTIGGQGLLIRVLESGIIGVIIIVPIGIEEGEVLLAPIDHRRGDLIYRVGVTGFGGGLGGGGTRQGQHRGQGQGRGIYAFLFAPFGCGYDTGLLLHINCIFKGSGERGQKLGAAGPGGTVLESEPMAEAIAFDTHRFVKHLTAHGFTEQQAEVLADEQVHLLNTNLATQADVAVIQRDIAGVQRDIAGVQRDIEGLRQETKAEMEALRQETKAEMEALRQETKADIAGVQREIEVLRQETKADIAGVQREIEVLRQETKADIAGVQREIEVLRQETKADIAGVQRDIEGLRHETRTGMEALRQETKAGLAEVKADLLKWMTGALIAQGGVIVALLKLLPG